MRSLMVPLVLGGLFLPLAARAQDARLALTEHLVLGTDPHDPNLMFGDPLLVRADGAGRLYVFDQLAMRVKVYDPEGQFVGSFGGRGRRPGQFNSISTAHVTSGGDVLVFDQFNNRLTRFRPDGEVAVDSLDPAAVLWPRDVVPLGSTYLLLYHHPDSPALLHEWDAGLTRPLRAFAPVADVPQSEDPLVESLLSLTAGHVARWGDRLALAPPLCGGRLLLYDLGSGRRLEDLQGAPLPRPSLERVPLPEGPAPDDLVVVSGPEGQLAGRVGCWSVGLVALADGGLAHFSVRHETGAKVAYVEVFDRAGALVGAHELGELASPEDRRPFVPVLVFGGSGGQLFVVDRRGPHPLVRVFDAAVTVLP